VLERGSIFIDLQKYKYPNTADETLKKLNFEISKGEFIGVLGRTGSGKTSTLMLLNGLIPHFFEGDFHGNVIVNTMNTQRYRVQTLSRFIGLVLQDPETQIFGVTVEKDVAFGPSNLCYSKEKIAALIKKSLASVGLQGFDKRITSELSGGEKQRLAIAGILAMEPEIIVLDEPTSELDPIGKMEIYKLLSEIKAKENVTIVVSGHDSEEMLNFVDRIVVLDSGKIGWQGKPEQLFKDIVLTEQFGIKPIETAEISTALSQKNIFKKESIFLRNAQLIEHISSNYNTNSIKNYINENKSTLKQKEIVIEVNDVSFNYRHDEAALNNINLKFYKGEFVALIGKNGAGKTTFSKHLNGLLRPSSGQVIINGRDIKTVSISELSREVGYVFQNPDHQIFSATVKEEIEYGLKNMNLALEEIVLRISKVLEFVGLKNFEKRHPFTLGKGERQKLAVASILAMEPSILVIDEPTTGQDWDGTKRMMAMMEELYKKGHTILAITHNLRLAAEYADRIIVFSGGEVVLDGTPIEVFSQREILESASVTPPDSVLLGEALNKIGFDGNIITVKNIKNELIEKLSIVNVN
jgi:energy-coupling factor transport system ATP-binding protein